MKSMILITALSFVVSLSAQERELLYENSLNSISLYEYKHDAKFKYVFFFKIANCPSTLCYGYANFKSLKEVKIFMKAMSQSMKADYPVSTIINNQSIDLYGVSDRITVFDIDEERGIIHIDDVNSIEAKLKRL